VKPKKHLPEWQAYSVLYYKKGLSERIQADWKIRYLENNPAHDPATEVPSAPMSFRNDKTREYYEHETDEVKEEVKEARKVAPQSVDELEAIAGDLSDGEDGRLALLAKFQR
jgi:hypothetical protein